MVSEKKVLIVDDNESLLMALEYNLRSAGYSVLKASNGLEAFAIASSEHPDIIVSDLTMPEMDGIELCKKYRAEISSETPFIFLTAHGEPEERIKGLKSGADDYIVKPFNIEELITRIDIFYRKILMNSSASSLSGDFNGLSLPDILQIFNQTRKEGILRIACGSEIGMITFRDEMIMEASFRGVTGEDALVELLMMRNGRFAYEQGRIHGGAVSLPINFVMLEAVRLIDERCALQEFIPRHDCGVRFIGDASAIEPSLAKIAAAMGEAVSSIKEITAITGMSHIRVEIAVANMIKEGLAARISDSLTPPPVSLANQRPYKILFVFSNENAASTFLKDTAATFGVTVPHGMKSGIADFLKLNISGRNVHLFSLRGDKRFSFLWEPMISGSDASIFLLKSDPDIEHAEYFSSRLQSIRNMPFTLISMTDDVSRADIKIVSGDSGIRGMFADLLQPVI